MHWLPNLFLVPFGSAGTSLVKEIARLFQAFADNSSLQRVSMKAISVIQLLLLQKPSKQSKTKDHVSHLQRRLKMWLKGDFLQLLEEGRCLQSRLVFRKQQLTKKVSNYIFRSKCPKAMYIVP